MLTLNEVIELRDKLLNNELEIELAQEQYWKDFKEGKKAWHTKDWKERRAKFIKDKCQICNSTDTLTLQHLSHGRRYSEYLTEIRRLYARDHIDTNPQVGKNDFHAHILEKYDYEPIPLCPNCKNANPKKRVRKLPEYRCAECKHEFDDPIYRSIEELISIFYENPDAMAVRDKCFLSKQWNNMHNLSNVKYWMQREQAKNTNSKAIEKEAFLLYLEDEIKYLSFEDTITACRRCAYKYDIKRMDLCPQCKTNYKGIQYPTCIQCLPEERRQAVMKTIEFENEMRQMHKDLGID